MLANEEYCSPFETADEHHCRAGADICGFMNLASPELCARWIALGAWYPYARVHHAQSFQELYRCGLDLPTLLSVDGFIKFCCWQLLLPRPAKAQMAPCNGCVVS